MTLEEGSEEENYGLRITLYQETTNGITVNRLLYKDFTSIDTTTYSFPSLTIDNTVEGNTNGEDIIYYLVVTSLIKVYSYGIKLTKLDAITPSGNTNQVIQFKLEGINYNNMSQSNIDDLKTEVQTEMISVVNNNSLLNTPDFYTITITSDSTNNNNTIVTVYFNNTITLKMQQLSAL